jgi:hypothetical protein
VRDNVIQLALDQPALSPRELAVRFTDTERYFVSEASVYRLLKARDLIASVGGGGLVLERIGRLDHSTSRRCRRVSRRYASPIQKDILSQRLRSTAC